MNQMFETIDNEEEKISNTLGAKLGDSQEPPKFRIYRMFTTIWNYVVLDTNLASKLENAVSKQLLLVQENIISHQLDDGPLGDVEDIKIIIKNFMLCVLDISLNENSIHYLLHSHVVLDHTYEIFEDLILRQAWVFIKSICEKIYNKHRISSLLAVLSYYSGILNEFGPMRFRRKLERKKTVIVSKFLRYIIKNRLKVFKRYCFQEKEGKRKKFLGLLQKYYEKYNIKIEDFFQKDSIFTKYCMKIFERN
mmetsp:Transcript_37348/g.36947  ORF Transcript_37348/g.36947 Transcript_37348/m.36947 type:complete len:250 (+) Transcript_37348:627-1376(+)